MPTDQHHTLDPAAGETRAPALDALPETTNEAKRALRRMERLSTLGATDAIDLLQQAAQNRLTADYLASQGDRTAPRHCLADAAALEQDAADILDPVSHATGPVQIGRGGELATGMAMMQPFLDTVRTHPDMLVHEASRDRMRLASNAGALEMALDVSETIQAANSLEKMLAHELAAVHVLMMKNAATAASFATSAADRTLSMSQRQTANVEAARSTNAAARASEAFQRGLLTVDRIRNGGRQVVTVQHVNVNAGGQAVVAGAVQPRGGVQK
jgi:hypothetical protein